MSLNIHDSALHKNIDISYTENYPLLKAYEKNESDITFFDAKFNTLVCSTNSNNFKTINRSKQGNISRYILLKQNETYTYKSHTETETVFDIYGSDIQLPIKITDDIIFDGNGSTIIIPTGVSDFPGLFKLNGGTVRNVNVSGSTTLAENQGWVIQTEATGIVENCSSNGNTSNYSGGICGSSPGLNGSCKITNCYSIGTVSNNSGGICGSNAGNSGNCTVTNCYSTGDISDNSGGIFGSDTENCTVTNCYSTGPVSGDNSGGIFGNNPGTVTLNFCYAINDTNNPTENINNFVNTSVSNHDFSAFTSDNGWKSVDSGDSINPPILLGDKIYTYEGNNLDSSLTDIASNQQYNDLNIFVGDNLYNFTYTVADKAAFTLPSEEV